ncbi:sce7726 family protein [Halomontanus rarus]|uniref:sce7726 family protein n=1 Tax=Halomontanus rarus TaxID=3034020 RepID=UPI001A980F1E
MSGDIATSRKNSMTTKRELITDIEFRYLKHISAHANLFRNNSTRSTHEDFINGFVNYLTKEECEFFNGSYKCGLGPVEAAERFKYEYRPDENVLREEFLSYLESSIDVENEAIFCEFPIAGNRSDVNRFNGNSYTYELKSPRDSFRRLDEQLQSYKRAFEYVYIVTLESEIDTDEIPQDIGVLSYDFPKFDFDIIQEPSCQERLDSRLQLEQLWLSELREITGEYGPKEANGDECKRYLIDEVQSKYDEESVNEIFKSCIKERYLGT